MGQNVRTEREMEELLRAVLEAEWPVNTFEEAGILTTNRGLIIQVDGSEFQVTIVRSGGAS